MDRRPALPKDLDGVADRLVEADGPDAYRAFETKQKVMMYAAALGYACDSRKKVERKAPGIRYDVFQGALDDGFINALAVAVTEDLNVLGESRADERIEIFEEYAHAGLEIMRRLCFELEGDPVDALIRRALEAQTTDSEIPGIDAGVLRNLLG